MKRITNLFSGLASTVGSVALLVGLPWALLAAVGNPFPSSVPTMDEITWYLTNGRIPEDFWFGLFAVVLWFVWIQLLVAFVVELISTLRGISTPDLAGFGVAQALVGPLIARVALVISMLGSSATAAGATPLSPALAQLPDVASSSASQILDAPSTLAESLDVGGFTPNSETAETGSVKIDVAKRDTLRTLAGTHLGSASEWKTLRDANVGRAMADGTVFGSDTVQIRSGWTLVLPTGATGAVTPAGVIQPAADVVEVDEVTVVEADHFWSLAQGVLSENWGRAPTDAELTPYWVQMVKANTDRLLPPGDPNLIYPDQEFIIPPVPADPLASPGLALSADAPLQARVTQDRGPLVIDDPAEVPADTEMPAATAATVTDVAPVGERSVEDATGSSSVVSGDLVKTVLLGTVGAFTLALLGLTINKLRKRRIDLRPDGADRPVMTPEIERIEDQVRALSDDGEAARYVAAVNPWLTHVLAATGFLPSVVAVRAGSHGVEVLLDEPCEMPEKFVQTSDNGSAWRVASDVSHRDMETDAAGAEPYCPGLIAVGDTPAGELLLDFEQLGAVTVNGDESARDGFLREIVVAALASPWATNCEIVAIGVPGIRPAPGSRVVVPDDPVLWAQTKAKAVARDAHDTTTSPYEARVKGVVEGYPTIVIVGSGFAAVAQHLAPASLLAHSSLTLIAGSELACESRIVLSDTAAVMEPSGLAWELRLVDDIDLVSIDELLSEAEAQVVAEAQGHDDIEIVVPVRQPEQAEPTTDIQGLIDEILVPCGVEVKVLRVDPVVEGVKLPAKLAAVTTYITLNPNTPAKTVKAQFWGEDDSRAAENSFTKIRRILGDTGDGARRFDKSTNLEFVDVGSDWQRFNALVELANSTSSVIDQAAVLDAALAFIEGEPAKNVAGVLWSWFTDDRHWYEVVNSLIVDAASMRARLALEADDPVKARWAVRRGQLGMPSSQALKRLSLMATKALEGDQSLDVEYKQSLAEAEADGYDLPTDTHRLYNQLRSQPSLRVVELAGEELSSAVGA